jgi:hypothetical protein
MTAPTQVLSALLCDPDAAVQMAGPLLRGLGLVARDSDFTESLVCGLTESDEAFAARIGGVL